MFRGARGRAEAQKNEASRPNWMRDAVYAASAMRARGLRPRPPSRVRSVVFFDDPGIPSDEQRCLQLAISVPAWLNSEVSASKPGGRHIVILSIWGSTVVHI